MHKLEELKDMLCKELEEYGECDNLDVGGLDVVDKLAHAIKNIDKIIEAEEEAYSGRGRSSRYEGGQSSRYEGQSSRYGGGQSSRYDGRSYEDSYEGRSSRYEGQSSRGRGRNARRDAMGRYSSGDMASELRKLMEDAPDEQTRMEIERMMQRFE